VACHTVIGFSGCVYGWSVTAAGNPVINYFGQNVVGNCWVEARNKYNIHGGGQALTYLIIRQTATPDACEDFYLSEIKFPDNTACNIADSGIACAGGVYGAIVGRSATYC